MFFSISAKNFPWNKVLKIRVTQQCWIQISDKYKIFFFEQK